MKTNASWGGRFSEGPKEAVAAYTESESYDRALAFQDIRASKAHARMLARQGVLTPEDGAALEKGLDMVAEEISRGEFTWKPELEDVHMNIEARLTQLVGEVGKRLHTGRSRNDQVGLTYRLYVSDTLAEWQRLLLALCKRFVARAEDHAEHILPGCTHLQPAQPVSLAHHLLAYAFMFKRDYERIEDTLKRVRVSPLGAAALAGTTYPLDPASVAKEVGFGGIYPNSMDAVSDRDFVLEALFDGSLIMTHLSRFCEEIILWANPNFGFVKLSDGYSTGSSIMPQKKNPDVAELMRGKTGRVDGALMALLTVVKGLPLAYNRDLQEDKEGFMDASHTVMTSLSVMEGMLGELGFNTERMEEACRRGFLNATEMADYLVGKGVPFREAHHITGHAVALAEQRNVGLEDLSLEDFRSLDARIGEDIYPVLDCHAAVRRRETPGGTGPKSVQAQLELLRSWLNSRGKGWQMAERRYTRRQKRAQAQNKSDAAQAPQKAPSTRRQKATGWKVPLIFCAVILLLTGAGWLYRKVTAPPPLPINAELFDYASKAHFDLDADEEGRKFKEELISAGRGFSPAYAKDEKIAAVAGQAIDAGRLDVLVTAIGVIRDGDRRTKLLKLLAPKAMERCEDLPWAVFAVRNLTHEYGTAMDLTRTLNARYEECKRTMPEGWPMTLIPTAPVGQDTKYSQGGDTQTDAKAQTKGAADTAQTGK